MSLRESLGGYDRHGISHCWYANERKRGIKNGVAKKKKESKELS